MKTIVIENTYTIIPEKNLFNHTKLEPRIMRLLCLLIENRGKLVSRDTIIDQIWNGYPGGINGLTQAISFLRKILNDSEKKIISTIPKSGYVFNGNIEIIDIESENMRPGKKYFKESPYYIVIFAAVLLTLFLLIFLKVNRQSTPQPQSIEYNDSMHTEGDAPKAK